MKILKFNIKVENNFRKCEEINITAETCHSIKKINEIKKGICFSWVKLYFYLLYSDPLNLLCLSEQLFSLCAPRLSGENITNFKYQFTPCIFKKIILFLTVLAHLLFFFLFCQFTSDSNFHFLSILNIIFYSKFSEKKHCNMSILNLVKQY